MEENEERKQFLINEGKTLRNKQNTRTIKIIGLFLIALGIILGILCYEYKVYAKVTKVWEVKYDNQYYEKYEFWYTFNGSEYMGVGEDDLAVGPAGVYFDITVGQSYPVYVMAIAPGSYHFQKLNLSLMFGLVLVTSGATLFVYGIVYRKRFLLQIQSVGDLNEDHKVDEKDLRVYSENQKKIEEDERKKLIEKDYCKYCGSKLAKTDLFCTNCGAKREAE